jgi:hypothetical protein
MPVRQFLRNLQMRVAFIAAFTSEKREMTVDDVQKKFIPLLAIDIQESGIFFFLL